MWEAALNPLLHPRARAAPASGTPPPSDTFIQKNQYQNILPHPHFHPPKFASPHCFTNLNLDLVGESIPKSAPNPHFHTNQIQIQISKTMGATKISGLFERATWRKHTIVPGEVICGKPRSILCFIQEPELRPHPALTRETPPPTHTFIHPNLVAPIVLLI